jgi:hypothetical protein
MQSEILKLTENPFFYLQIKDKDYRMDEDPEHIGLVGFIVFKTPTGSKRRFGTLIDIPANAGYHVICNAGNVWRGAVKRLYTGCKEIYTIGWTHRVPWIDGVHKWEGTGPTPPYYEGAFRQSYFNRN